MTPQEISQFIESLKNSSLPVDRKMYFADIVKEKGFLPDDVRLELQKELEDEIAIIDETLVSLDRENIQKSVEITEKERKEEALLEKMDEKMKKLEQLKYEYDDKLAAIDDFYDPILEENLSEESRKKLQEEKEGKVAALEAEYEKLAKNGSLAS